MDLSITVTVFALVAVAELPDKTMIATLVMGSRSRPLLVWIGASGAFLVHTAVAVAAGRVLGLLPHRALEIVTTSLFFAGAVYLLVVPERLEEARGRREGTRELPERPWPVIGTAFTVILVAELGDLTQILTANLEARYHQPASVFMGAFAALLAASALGAFGGRALQRYVSLATIRRLGGVALLGFTGYGIYSLLR